MKQETPEEAAERLYPMVGNEYLWNIPIQRREGFIAGAEWQQQRSFSEEDMNQYSDYVLMCSAEKTFKLPLPPKEWFKQFKNK